MAPTAVYTPLQALITAITENSEKLSKYLTGDGIEKPWMIPPGRGWDGDLTAIEEMAEAFERSQISDDAKDNIDGDGTVGIGNSLMLQAALMGVMERSFRHRHMTPIRARMHAAGRKKGHSLANGIHGDAVRYMQDMLASGGAVSTPTTVAP